MSTPLLTNVTSTTVGSTISLAPATISIVAVTLTGIGYVTATIVAQGSNDNFVTFTSIDTSILAGNNSVVYGESYPNLPYTSFRLVVSAINGTGATLNGNLQTQLIVSPTENPSTVADDITAATANRILINSALASSRFVSIGTQGTVYIDGSIIIPNRGDLEIKAGCTLKRNDYSDVPVIKNKADGYTLEGVYFSRSGSNVVTVIDKNHTFNVGDTVSIRNSQVSAYNGVFTITYADAAGWKYVCGSSGTDTAGATNYYLFVVPILRTIAPASVTNALVSASVTITIAAPGVITWTGHGLGPNQAIQFSTTGALPTGLSANTTYYVVPNEIAKDTFQVSSSKNGAAITTSGTQSGVHTASYSIATVSDPLLDMRVGMFVYVTPYNTADSAYGGVVQVAKVWSSTNSETIDRWMYYTPGAATSAAPAGNLGLTYSYDITLRGAGQVDGNRSHILTTTPRSNLTAWSMVNNLSIKGLKLTGTNNRGLSCYNAYGVTLEDLQFDNVASAITFEGGSIDTAIKHCYASDSNYQTGTQQTDDFIAYLGEKMLNTGVIIDVTPSPFGITDHTNAIIEDCSCTNSLNGLKFIGDAQQTFRNFKIKNFSGILNDPTPASRFQTAVFMGDDGTGALSGCVYESFEFDGIIWRSFDKLAGLNGIYLSQSARHGKIVIKNFTRDPSQASALHVSFTSGSIRQLDILDCDWYDLVQFQRRPIYINGAVNTLTVSGTFKLTGNANNSVIFVEGNAGVLVKNLVILNSRYEGSAANTGYLIAINGAVNNLTYQNVKPLGVSGNSCNSLALLYPNANGQASSSYINVSYLGCLLRGGNGITDGGNDLGTTAVNIYASNTIWEPTGGGNFVDLGGPGVVPCTIYAGSDCKITSQALNTAGGSRYSLFAPTLKAAVNAGVAGTTIARTAGANFMNTAAAGTLVANNPIICDATNAANSWKQMTAPANQY